MTRIRGILGLVLVVGLMATLANAADDDNAKKKKKGDANTTFGTITSVDPDKEKPDTGTITCKAGAGKGKAGGGIKGGANGAADAVNSSEKKFTYDKDTTFEKMSGGGFGKGKDKGKKESAKAADCKDQRVLIKSADGKKADTVTILPMMMRPNANNN
jgi:hypothetical protein